jgi:hypothetical protein
MEIPPGLRGVDLSFCRYGLICLRSCTGNLFFAHSLNECVGNLLLLEIGLAACNKTLTYIP